jgi:hypothetical protein
MAASLAAPDPKRPLPVDAMRARACAICVASVASDWLPLWTLRVLSGIEVPM